MSGHKLLPSVDKELLLAGVLGVVVAENVTTLCDDGSVKSAGIYQDALYRAGSDLEQGVVRYVPVGTGWRPLRCVLPKSAGALTIA